MKIKQYLTEPLSKMQENYQEFIGEDEEVFVINDNYRAGYFAGRKELETKLAEAEQTIRYLKTSRQEHYLASVENEKKLKIASEALEKIQAGINMGPIMMIGEAIRALKKLKGDSNDT